MIDDKKDEMKFKSDQMRIRMEVRRKRVARQMNYK